MSSAFPQLTRRGDSPRSSGRWSSSGSSWPCSSDATAGCDATPPSRGRVSSHRKRGVLRAQILLRGLVDARDGGDDHHHDDVEEQGGYPDVEVLPRRG